jgi:hypothetical protein
VGAYRGSGPTVGNPWGGGRVPFDFDGSLTLARRLWSLADLVDHDMARRGQAADIARARWRGPYRAEFDTRVDIEANSARRIAEGLREEAKGWAEAWREALEEQNRRNRAARVAEERNSRGWFERNIGDRFGGDDSEDQVPPCPTVPLPKPPGFVPTAHEWRF